MVNALPKDTSFELKIKPEKEFEKLFYRDAKYKMTNVQMYVEKRNGIKNLLKTFPNSTKDFISIDLKDFKLDSGDIVYFEVEKVIRINYLKEEFEEKMSSQSRNLMFVVK